MYVCMYPPAIVVYAQFTRAADIYCLFQNGLGSWKGSKKKPNDNIYYGPGT